MTIQVVCCISLTPSKTREDKGASDGGLDARKAAYSDVEKACNSVKVDFCQMNFEKLDFGETEYLDRFYNADVAIVDMSIQLQQASLFYHIGVRESMGMPETVILLNDIDPEFTLSVKLSCGQTDFLPYIVDTDGKCMVMDNTCSLGESMGMKSGDKPHSLLMRLKKILKQVETTCKTHVKEKFLADLRKARETYKGEELGKVLTLMRNRMDDPELLSSDIVLNLLISYRDIQDYDAMVSLVEAIDALPNVKVTSTVAIQHLYAFALNRRNTPADRDKALTVILKAIEMSDTPVPDMICLCGRIYKDKFVQSEYQDKDALQHATQWYQKGFDVQPNEYAGINLATLLVISGKRFSTSATLQRIGLTLNNLIGRKGSLSSLNDYWDVATFFEVSVLAEDYGKAVQAAECMARLEPPMWYLKSTLGNIKLINTFRKEELNTENTRERELFNFWMDFFTEATKTETNDVRFPIIIIEPQKIMMPSYAQVNEGDEEQSIHIWHVLPQPNSKKIHEWQFYSSSIKSISHYRRNARAIFLYVHDNSDDFQMFFPSEHHKQRFYDMVVEMIKTSENPDVVLDIECDVKQTNLRYEYETDEKGQRVLLGRGTYGAVYAARDLDTQVRIAIKEVPEKNAEDVQPLHEEIMLHSRLSNPHIVKYLGSVSEDGFFKIFMEQVPGGSLSALLRSKWGPLKDNEATIAFYTRQILKGLEYLHSVKIVHRDIKGDNVLVNTYSGVLKISDFGTSKRLAGINPHAGTFAGTLQYMAPEVIDKGIRGYGPAADIWSLGCTVIEMATGKPPFIELGSPQAAMFKVGFYKMHPEIPESMSENAKTFLLRCFDPDPDQRATASELLEHPFLAETSKKKSRQHSKVEHHLQTPQPDYSRSISVPGLPPMSKTVDATPATAAVHNSHRGTIHRNLHLKMPNSDRKPESSRSRPMSEIITSFHHMPDIPFTPAIPETPRFVALLLLLLLPKRLSIFRLFSWHVDLTQLFK